MFLVSLGMVSHIAFADSVTTTIPVSGAYDVAANSNTNMAYVANGNTYRIQVINGTTDTVVANVTTATVLSYYHGCHDYTVAINPKTNLIYTNNNECYYFPPAGGTAWSSQSVSVINGTNNQVINGVTIATAAFPYEPPQPIAVNPATNEIYALVGSPSFYYLAYIDVINGTTNQVTARISLPDYYDSDIAINTKTNTIYALNGAVIHVIDGTTKSIVKNINWGKSAEGLGVNPITNKIYVSNSDNSVSVIDGSTYQVMANITNTGYGFVRVNPTTDKIYVSNPGSTRELSVIDGSTNTLLSTIAVGSDSYGIGINTNTNKIYVGNSGSSSVSVLDGNADNTSPTVPSPPLNVQAIPGDDQVGLSWSAPSNNGGSAITNYNIYRSTDSGTLTLSATIGNVTSYTDAGNGNGITLYYKITAVNSLGESVSSNLASATPQSCTNPNKTIPTPPIGLKATAVSSSQIDLNWNPPDNDGGCNITQYTIERTTSSGAEFGTTMAIGVAGNVNSYSDTSVTSGTTYSYTVTATSSAGDSAPSNEVSATPAAAPVTVSSAPTGLTATTISSSQINLSWAAPASNGGSKVTGYMIQRSTDGGSTWSTIISNSGSTSTVYSDTGLAASTTYTYQVSAINSVGTSQPSNIASATTSGITITSGIVLNNVQSTSGTTSSSNQITLSGFNAGIDSNQLLLVGISANNNSPVSVTFNGVQLTQAVGSFYNNDAEFWYLKNPTGTGNIVVTMGGPTQAVVGAYSFSGVNQTAPIATHVARHNTTPNSPNISITTKYANDWVLDLPSIYGGSTLGSPTCTQQWDLNVPNAITGASSSIMIPSPATVTCKWTASSADFWDDVAVELRTAG